MKKTYRIALFLLAIATAATGQEADEDHPEPGALADKTMRFPRVLAERQ